MAESLIELRKKPHTSISAIKTALSCIRRYNLQYVSRIRPAFRPAALAFGSAWHETIARWLTSPEVEAEELREHLRDGLITRLRAEDNVLFDDADDDEGTLVDTAVRMLNAFLSHVSRPGRTFAVELPFELELAHPLTGEVLGVPLIGSLDAIVHESGRSAVWELKSGNKRWSADQLEFDFQVTAYGMAARQEGYDGIDLKFIVVTKGKEPSVQRETVIRHRADEQELVELALGVQKTVNAGIDYPNRGWQCRTCPYATACRP